jgi:hypothetical protein
MVTPETETTRLDRFGRAQSRDPMTQPVTYLRTITPVADDDWYKANPRPRPARQPKPGELLFEFHVPQTHTFWRVELRDNGVYGVEVQFLDPIDVRIARSFRQDMDPDRTPRAMAMAWAQLERAAKEAYDPESR